jgi:short-subunit dehydrogenase
MSRLAMVTGASSGIGEAFAERLAEDGWDLVLVARRRDRLEELAARLTGEHGVSARVAKADLADEDQLRALCTEAAETPLGLLVNNAALAHYMPFAELPVEPAQELVQLNVLAPVLLTRAVLPGMIVRGQGAVINVASLLAFSGSWEAPHLPQRAVYAATKSFLVTFTQILAGELEGSGVLAQVVCPGVVRTEFHSRQGMDLSAVPRMEPRSVVDASLLDLEHGVVVSIPGSADASAHDRIGAAQRELMGATRAVELPDRYRIEPHV